MKKLFYILTLLISFQGFGQIYAIPNKAFGCDHDSINYLTNAGVVTFMHDYGLRDVYTENIGLKNLDDLNKLNDYIVDYTKGIDSVKTYIRTEHGGEYRYYISVFTNKNGYLHTLKISEQSNQTGGYIEFKANRVKCDFGKHSPNTTSSEGDINYFDKRKVVDVVNQDKLFQIKFDDGSTVSYHFCYPDERRGNLKWWFIDSSFCNEYYNSCGGTRMAYSYESKTTCNHN